MFGIIYPAFHLKSSCFIKNRSLFQRKMIQLALYRHSRPKHLLESEDSVFIEAFKIASLIMPIQEFAKLPWCQ